MWDGAANLVEINFLREGEPTVRVSREQLDSLDPWRYLVAITRCSPSQQEVYAVALQHRLPRIAVPLSAEDADVALDLQAAFDRCWNEGPYPELLAYDQRPPGELNDAETEWCEQVLRDAELRS